MISAVHFNSIPPGPPSVQRDRVLSILVMAQHGLTYVSVGRNTVTANGGALSRTAGVKE